MYLCCIYTCTEQVLSEGLDNHDFSPAAVAHLMHWLGAGGILEEVCLYFCLSVFSFCVPLCVSDSDSDFDSLALLLAVSQGWHSIPFTQFMKRLQLLADGSLVLKSGKNTQSPPQRQQQEGRTGKKMANKPLHGRRSAPPVL